MSAHSLYLQQLHDGGPIESDLRPDWTPAPTGRRVIMRETPEYRASIEALRVAQQLTARKDT